MNKVFLIGNLTRDPETRTTQGGTTVCSFTIAVNRRMKQDGQQETDFLNIVAWQKLGELCQKYLAKGRKCSVVGRIQTSSYLAKDGSKRTAWDDTLRPSARRRARRLTRVLRRLRTRICRSDGR